MKKKLKDLKDETGLMYLSYLSAKDQKAFMINFLNYSRLTTFVYLSQKFNSFESFTGAAFIWSVTPEGHTYWDNKFNKYLDQ